jgi:hypothetical protein
MHPLLLFAVFAVAAVAFAYHAGVQARRRREALAALASGLGLRFDPQRDRDLPCRFHFLDRMGRGRNRYAQNVFSGRLRGHDVMAFDYHYETRSRNSKGHTQTRHHWLSFFLLTLPRSFPELTITREGIFSKLAQAVGYDDIDFESHEFSRTFCVRSRDKKFAYDVCHARMMEYLLANRDLSIEIDENVLTFGFDSRLALERVERNLERLVEVRELMPEYLFE